jgi:hypothetical protein
MSLSLENFMTLEQQSELRLLQIRNAIADKEKHIATANHELGKYRGWQSDWNTTFSNTERQIEYLIDQLKKGE